LSFDYRNRLVQHIGARRHTYAYDAFGRRIARTVDADGTPQETRYFYDGWRVCEEQDASGATQATYVYGLYTDEVLNMRRGGQDYYYHTDDLYNVMAITDGTGAVRERYEYADYGSPIDPETLAPVGADPSALGNPYLFQGRRFDPETGLYYFRNRYLNPEQGRFVSRDPLGLWGDLGNQGNAYSFAGNNPVNRVDPFGLTTDEEARAATILYRSAALLDRTADAAGQNRALQQNLHKLATAYRRMAESLAPLTVTLSVDQPGKGGDRDTSEQKPGTWDPRAQDVGHAFIELGEKGKVQHAAGFYPTGQVYPGVRTKFPGLVRDDTDHKRDVELIYGLTEDQYKATVGHIESQKKTPPGYDLDKYNCVDWGFDALKEDGEKAEKRKKGGWGLGGGHNPGDLGEDVFLEGGVRVKRGNKGGGSCSW
jgi:RHS repeat-associated protein